MKKLAAVHDRHVQIEQDQVRTRCGRRVIKRTQLPQVIEGLCTIADDTQIGANNLVRENPAGQFTVAGVVVDEEDGGATDSFLRGVCIGHV